MVHLDCNFRKARFIMIRLTELVEFNSGTPQFRIRESLDADAPVYYYYGRSEMDVDLTGVEVWNSNKRQIRTSDGVATLISGDLVLSLITGKAAIVRDSHNRYLYTQNYVKLAPVSEVDTAYLAYILNENADIKQQMLSSQQGSETLKFTLKQLRNLLIPTPPLIKKQRIIGELYSNQLRLAALKKRVAATETKLILRKLREANKS